ncbi:hypothetical protein [Chromobacterium phragmitis]|uniref:hypothetical protein n=1 Tax=Chromobacterium phragmitis TaxID=2202141 RepID=UPI00326655EC
MFKRREFLKAAGAGLMLTVLPNLSWALAPAGYKRLLVLVELKGGNDGLNTVVPYGSADYYRTVSRERSGEKRQSLVKLASRNCACAANERFGTAEPRAGT